MHIIGTVSIVTVTALVLGSIDKHGICHCDCGWLDLIEYIRLQQFGYGSPLIKYVVLYHTVYPCGWRKYNYLIIHDLCGATTITIRARYTLVPKMHLENKAFLTLLWAWYKVYWCYTRSTFWINLKCTFTLPHQVWRHSYFIINESCAGADVPW